MPSSGGGWQQQRKCGRYSPTTLQLAFVRHSSLRRCFCCICWVQFLFTRQKRPRWSNNLLCLQVFLLLLCGRGGVVCIRMTLKLPHNAMAAKLPLHIQALKSITNYKNIVYMCGSVSAGRRLAYLMWFLIATESQPMCRFKYIYTNTQIRPVQCVTFAVVISAGGVQSGAVWVAGPSKPWRHSLCLPAVECIRSLSVDSLNAENCKFAPTTALPPIDANELSNYVRLLTVCAAS